MILDAVLLLVELRGASSGYSQHPLIARNNYHTALRLPEKNRKETS